MYRKMTMLVTALVLGTSTFVGALSSVSPALARAQRQHHAAPARASQGGWQVGVGTYLQDRHDATNTNGS